MFNKNRLIIGALLGFLLAGDAYSLTITSRSSDGKWSFVEYNQIIPAVPKQTIKVHIGGCPITADKGKSGSLIFELKEKDPDALKITLTSDASFEWTFKPSNSAIVDRNPDKSKIRIIAIAPTEEGKCAKSPITAKITLYQPQ